MLRLLSFLSKNQNILLFLLLEAVAFWLVVRFNEPQRHAVGDSLLEASAAVQDQKQKVSEYFFLKEGNVQLQDENDSLRNLIDVLQSKLTVAEAIIEVDSTRSGLIDSLQSREEFTYIPTRAIRHTHSLSRNYITLDKGTLHGVKEEMGLISPQGIAGFVVKASPNFSLALSIISNGVGIGAKVENLPIKPTFVWGGDDPEHGTLKWIPLDVDLKPGMKVLTSGIQSRFPANFVIGYIEGLKEDPQVGFYEVTVRLATDFKALNKLYLVSLNHKEEIDKLREDLKQ